MKPGFARAVRSWPRVPQTPPLPHPCKAWNSMGPPLSGIMPADVRNPYRGPPPPNEPNACIPIHGSHQLRAGSLDSGSRMMVSFPCRCRMRGLAAMGSLSWFPCVSSLQLGPFQTQVKKWVIARALSLRSAPHAYLGISKLIYSVIKASFNSPRFMFHCASCVHIWLDDH